MKHRSIMASNFEGAETSREDVDPLSGMTNLADVMLVFACGLMLALVTYWNLDISPDMVQVEENVEEVQDSIEQTPEDMMGGGTGYEEMGMVYRDPETGKMYMISKNEE